VQHLLRRADPFPGESIRGYMIRLAQLNRTTPLQIYRKSVLMAVRSVPRSLLMIMDKVPLSKLQELSQIEESKLYDLSFYSLAGKYGNKDEDLKILKCISTYVFCSLKFSQVCPFCLRDGHYHRKLWEIRMVTICHLHQCKLVSTCPKCKNYLSPLRRFVTYCDCGFDLQKCSVEHVNSQDILLSAYIYERYLVGNKTTHLTEEFQELSFRHFLYLFIFFYNYVFRCEFSLSDLKYSSSYKPEVIHQVSLKTFEMLFGWPNSFYQFIETYRKIPRNMNSAVQKDFGRFHDQLIKLFSLEEFSFVLNTFLQYCGENPFDHILEQVKKAIVKSLTKDEKKDDIPIPEDKLITTKSAAKILGVNDSRVIDGLISNGVIRIVDSNKRAYRFCFLNDIDNVIKTISSNSLTEGEYLENSDKEIVEFRYIKKLLRQRKSLLQFIVDVLEGKISACGVNSKEIGLNQFSFFKDDVEQLISNGTLRIDEAARLLNVTEQALRGWIKEGFIKRNNKGRYYSLNSYLRKNLIFQ
jgi:phage antirepressor YoqD-like protein